MEKSESDSSSKSEEEKITETSLKTSDLKKNETNKIFYSIYGSGSVEEEEKEQKNNNINKKEEQLSLKHRPSVIERGLMESVRKMENVTKEKLVLAEKINYKNNTDSLIETDEFGFLKNQNQKNENNINNMNTPEKKEAKISSEELLKINARTEKWQDMLEHYKKYQTLKKYKLKSRTRKGVPDNLRSYVWQLFAEKDKLVEKNLFEKLDKEEIDKETELRHGLFSRNIFIIYGRRKRFLYVACDC